MGDKCDSSSKPCAGCCWVIYVERIDAFCGEVGRGRVRGSAQAQFQRLPGLTEMMEAGE